MSQKEKIFSYGNRIVTALAYAADPFAGTKYTDVIKMGQAELITFLVFLHEVAAGDTTISVNACDDNVPTTEVAAVPFSHRTITPPDTAGAVTHGATSLLTTQSALAIIEISVSAAAIQAKCQAAGTIIPTAVRLKFVEATNVPVAGAAVAILSGQRLRGSEAAQDSQV